MTQAPDQIAKQSECRRGKRLVACRSRRHASTFPYRVDLFRLRSRIVKEGIHPKYVESQVTCGCGNRFTTRSTKPELKVDICSACHPFYTGKLKYVDTAGRIEKFQRKFAATGYTSLKRGKKQAAKAAEQSEEA
jgi:large subunit ribosomal protein L31